MKRTIFKIAVFFAVVSFGFYSCIPETTDSNPPTINVNSPVADTIEVFVGDSVNFVVAISSENSLKSLLVLSSSGNVILKNNDLEFTNSTSETVTVTAVVTETAEDNEAAEIVFTVNDANKSANTKKVIVAKVKATPLSEPADFTWERIGAPAATGLLEFGLLWDSNGADGKFAIIKKDATKFVILEPAQWTTITNLEDLKAAIDAAENVESWKGVSAQASASYDFTLGTIKDETYFLIHITKGEVKSVTAGTQITITGQYKK